MEKLQFDKMISGSIEKLVQQKYNGHNSKMYIVRKMFRQGIGDDNWGTSAVFAQEEDFLHQLLWGVRQTCRRQSSQ